MKLSGKVAFITGAGSGIGRGLSHALARRGCHIALADIDQEGLHETAAQLGKYNVQLSEHVLDVADRAAVAALPEAIIAAHGAIDVVVNNAGVGLGGDFMRASEADFDWVMEINFHAVVRITRAFLPHLLQRPEAALVNISSLYGLVSTEGNTHYCASKFAVRGFSNALRLELADTKLHICVVHPGGVATNIAKKARLSAGVSEEEVVEHQARMAKLLRLPPAKAGEVIARGIERNKQRVLVGIDAKFISLIERLWPVSYGKVVQKLTEWRS